MNSKKSNQTKNQHLLQPRHRQHQNVFHNLQASNSHLLDLYDKKSSNTNNNKKEFEVLNVGATAPPPSKDFAQLILTSDKIVMRKWHITRRVDAESRYPSEIKDSYEDFVDDEILQREIARFFGQHTFTYLVNMIEKGKLDLLCRLPEGIVLKIVSCLSLEDIARLSQVNALFRQVCRSDVVWKNLYQKYYSREITNELVQLAERDGWRKLFFTNKIKLQLELRRQAKSSLRSSQIVEEEEAIESLFNTPRRMAHEAEYRTEKRNNLKSGSARNLSSASGQRFSTYLTEMNN